MIDTYKNYRNTQIRLYEKIKTVLSKEMILYAGKILDIINDDTLRFESKDEIDYLYDFMYYEKIFNNESATDLYLKKANGITRLEKSILEAMKYAYTSLFQIKSVNPINAQVELVDLLNKGRTVTITDINMSQTGNSSILLFTRIIQESQLSHASGLIMIFNINQANRLLKSLKNQPLIMSKEITQYKHFFNTNRKMGIIFETDNI